jgi:hypothetical protein
VENSRRNSDHALYDSDHHLDPVVDRRAAQVALQRRRGYGPGGLLGLILIIVVILALLGRI